MNNTQILLTLAAALAIMSLSAQTTHKELPTSDPRLAQQPLSKSAGAKAVLDGTIKWQVPYKPEIKYNTEGFALQRLGRVPKKGEHPRMVTSPAELGDAFKRLSESKMGKMMLSVADKELEKMRQGKGPYGTTYLKLLKGTIPGAEAAKINYRLMNHLAVQALTAQMRGDKELLRTTGIASHNYLMSYAAHVESLPKIEGLEEHIPEPIILYGRIAKFYDYTAAGMTTAERKKFADFVGKQTAGKFVDGMDLPPHWRRWNHIAMAVCSPLTLVAVEGDTQLLDERIYRRGIEMSEDYFTYNYSPEGMSTEGMNYTLGQMPQVLSFAIAAARRGDKNLLTHPHLRAMSDWMIYTMSPNPQALWSTGGDTGTRSTPPWDMVMMLRYFYPEDKKLDYILANALPEKLNEIPDVNAYMFCADPTLSRDGYNGVPPVDMPLTYSSMMRGMFIARDKWDVNGVKFGMEARSDTYFPSHDHSDRGAFTLSANGRDWVVDAFRSTEGKYHATITIDGRGQGYFATPASWLNYTQTSEASIGTVDYKYCFDWMWLKSPVADLLLERDVPKKWSEGVYGAAAANLKRYFPNIKPERDPLERVAEYYDGNLKTNPLVWKEDTWPMRMEHYPVEYAFRTGGLINGKHPYVLIIDDLRKDDAERLYEWIAPMPMDVELVSIKQLVDVKQESGPLNIGFNTLTNMRRSGEYDMLLGDKSMKRDMRPVDNTAGGTYSTGTFTPTKGDNMLLVRVLDKCDAAVPHLEPNPSLQTIEHLKTENMHQFYLRTMGLGKRLVIPSRSNEGRFKVLLFPHRHGEQMPSTQWNDDRTQLDVKWSDQHDQYRFAKGDDGRTSVTLHRDGKLIFNTK